MSRLSVRGFLKNSRASHPEIDVVVDPLPQLRLLLRGLAGVIVLTPGRHHFVVHRPDSHAVARDVLLPVNRDRWTRVKQTQGGVLREVLEPADADFTILAQTVVLGSRRI